MAKTDALQGKNVVLLWRLEKNRKTDIGTLLMFQTEHNVEKTRDSDSVATKSGTIRKAGVMEEEISFSSIVGVGDKMIDTLNEAIDDGLLIELWEVDITKTGSAENKYSAIYRQGYITSLSKTANAEDEVEIEGTYATNMKGQKGEVTLTVEQIEAIQYTFKDVTVDNG